MTDLTRRTLLDPLALDGRGRSASPASCKPPVPSTAS